MAPDKGDRKMAFSMLALGLVGSMMVLGFIAFCGYALYDTLFNKEFC